MCPRASELLEGGGEVNWTLIGEPGLARLGGATPSTEWHIPQGGVLNATTHLKGSRRCHLTS